MKKYKKKPVEIQAVLYGGDNKDEITAFCGGAADISGDALIVHTLEGDKTANAGDFIIRGVKGEFYPCSADKFRANNTHISGNTYRKNASVEVDAAQFTGDNFPEIVQFTKPTGRTATDYDADAGFCKIPHPGREPYICHVGDYVIRNGNSVYPCESAIFAQTYSLSENA